jgi:hypothetical protein
MNDELENEGLCHNPLCGAEEWPSEMIGHQCDCGGYIWHKDDFCKDDFYEDDFTEECAQERLPAPEDTSNQLPLFPMVTQ